MMYPPGLRNGPQHNVQGHHAQRGGDHAYVSECLMRGAADQCRIILTRHAGSHDSHGVAENRDRNRHREKQSLHGGAPHEKVVVQNAHEEMATKERMPLQASSTDSLMPTI